MLATFLSASVPLTKTFTKENDEIKKIGHPRIVDYTSYEEQFDTIEQLYDFLVAHAEKGHCFLKGNLTRQLCNEPRAGTTDPNTPTRILLLDFDGIKGVTDVGYLLNHLGLDAVDYIVQYSSSMGVLPDRGLSAHIFILLTSATYPAILKQWLTNANLTVPLLKTNLGLTRTNNALRWALDITTCQNDKLIYIAPPILENGVIDEFKEQRIQLVKKQNRVYNINGLIPSAEANKQSSEAVLNQLRKEAGLPERKKIVYKSEGNIEYMAKPDRATVSEIKRERGFVYLNLNGGDSWGYYHAESNPDFIYNFKSEPVYKTSELLPDYWRDIRKEINNPKIDERDGVVRLVLRDYKSAAYWNGFYDPKSGALDLKLARTKDQLHDYLKEHGQPLPDYISTWEMEFTPNWPKTIDLENKRINLFQPTEFMKQEVKEVTEVPQAIRRLIHHALGSDDECFEHMMNWLAVIVQHRCKAETCWVLHGIPGTGKGQFLNRVLRRIFGYVVSKRTRELDSQFNDYLERCLILWVDEAEIALHDGADKIEGDLKNYIVEPMISIRKMYSNAYEVKSYLNVILASNKGQIITIDPKDRRYNVAVFQDKKFITSDEELAQIEDELYDFYCYLATRKADKEVARTPLNNAAKQKMIAIGMAAIDIAAQALAEGNLEFFEEQKPSGHISQGNFSRDQMADAYSKLVDEIREGKHPALSREELQMMLEYTIGGIPASPHKFTSFIKHHNIHLVPIKKNGKTIRGVKVEWKVEWNLSQEKS